MYRQDAPATQTHSPTIPFVPSRFSHYLEDTRSRLPTPLVLLLALLAGCGGDGPSEVPQPQADFTSLSLSTSSGTIYSRPPGNSAALTARALDQNGQPMGGLGTPTFTSDDSGIASVDPSGNVTAVASGSTSIRASLTANGVTRTAAVAITVTDGATEATVTAPLVEFTPRVVDLALGGTVTWAFESIPHNVVFSTQGAPADLPAPWSNASHSRTFPTAGSFRYECGLHAGMSGEVIVR
ncbi:MAG: Ig-like domain-containing protein [Gemmatimonadetes bacterium]|nr:Ig-like domain-containing protein [Gemmatimonadota bacterium]